MKKILFVIMCFVAVFAMAQTKRATSFYNTQSVNGMWITAKVYNENTHEWQDVDTEGMFAFGFTSTKTNGKDIAIMVATGQDTNRFTYKVVNNTISLYDITDSTNKLITIKILSLKRGQEMIGKISTSSSIYTAKYKLIYVDKM